MDYIFYYKSLEWNFIVHVYPSRETLRAKLFFKII